MVLGLTGCGECLAGGLCGGGGQIFRRGTLKKMFENGRRSFLEEQHHEAARNEGFGDVAKCMVAYHHFIPVINLPGLHGWQLKPAEYTDFLPHALTFHYVSAQAMHQVHQQYQSMPAHMSMSQLDYNLYHAMMREEFTQSENERRRLEAKLN